MKKIIIAAVAKNGVIGKSSGEMPWYSKAEFSHFKKTTLGFPVIMGRKTFESLGKSLGSRLNIILTKNLKLKEKFSEIAIFSDLNNAYNFCQSEKFEKVFIIGGGQIFQKAIDEADEMIISYMDFNAEGDVFFPKIDLNKWYITKREQRKDFEIVNYIRKN
jgi:dihydrofolate reductase